MTGPYHSGIVSQSLVTFEQFARFIRTEAYFRAEFWDRLTTPPQIGGDEVLRRIEFHWERRQHAVVGVSWYEADAYCRYAGGRLPWRQELLALYRELPPRRNTPEWAGDWYNPIVDGPNVLPDYSRSKRVERWSEEECAAPDLIRGPMGFRVVREQFGRSV